MILELDLGNTRIKWRILGSGSDVNERGVFSTNENNIEFIEELVRKVDRVRLASVCSIETDVAIEQLCDGTGKQFFKASSQKQCGNVTNSYHAPSTMGVDRWLAMVAAYNLAKKPCCVIDCGSAITVDVINSQGEHQGGFIVPGLHMLKGSLFESTKRVRFSLAESLNSCSLGRNTQEAVNHGVLSMVTDWINERCNKVVEEYGLDAGLYLTGGDAEFLLNYLNNEVKYCPDLVLDGLAYCELNR